MRTAVSVTALLVAIGGAAAAQTVVIPPPAPAVVPSTTVTVSPPPPPAAATIATTTVPAVVPAATEQIIVSRVYVPQGAINTAVEQPAPWAPAPVGSVIETTTGKQTVKVVNNYDIVYDVNGNRKVMHGMFVDGDDAGRAGRTAVQQLWPLQVGKQVSYSVDDPRGTRDDVVRVVRTEVIKVPAGTFYTYLVQRRERPPLTNVEQISNMWYAPSVGAIVKQEDWTGDYTRGQTTTLGTAAPAKPAHHYEVVRMQMPAALPGSVVIASAQRPDTVVMQTQYCRERGTTVRTTDGRMVNLDCTTFIQVDRVAYENWLAQR